MIYEFEINLGDMKNIDKIYEFNRYNPNPFFPYRMIKPEEIVSKALHILHLEMLKQNIEEEENQ